MGSVNKSEEQSATDKKSFVDPSQDKYLQEIYGQASGLNRDAMGRADQFGRTEGADLYAGGRANLPGQGGSQGARDAAGRLASGVGITDPGMLDPYLSAVGNDITEQLMRQLGGAGGIGTGFGVGGTAGGGRESVERGIAQGDAARTFATVAGKARMDDLAQRRQLGLDSQIAAGGMSLGEGRLGLDQSMGYQQALNPLMNLGLGGINAGYSSLLNYKNVLGAPTVLDQMQQRGRSQNEGIEVFQV